MNRTYMHSRFSTYGVTFFILLSIVGTCVSIPNTASADQVSDLRSQLQQVLTQIATLQSQLAATTTGTGATGCPALTLSMGPGSSNSQVSQLQSYLARDPAIYPQGLVTGYYGPATQAAVERFQVRYGVVASGTPNTTGYGFVGAKTRAKIAEVCGGGSTGNGTTGSVPAQVVNFAFQNTGGVAPVSVTAKLSFLDALCVSYEVDWGDGTSPTTYDAPSSTNCGTGIIERTLEHTYNQYGTFTATLKSVKGPRSQVATTLTRQITIAKGDPYVTVTSPSVGSTIRLGDYIKLKWLTGNYPSDAGIAFYMVGPTQTYLVAKRSMRTTEFDWIVGDRVCDGNTCDVQMPVGQYKMRAVMFSPVDGCIDFCGTDDARATVLSTSETGLFTVTQIGTGGAAPIAVSGSRGTAPYTVNIHAEITPQSSGGNFEVDFGDGSSKYSIHVPIGETRNTVRDIPHTYTKIGTFTISMRPVGAVQSIGSAQVVVDSPTLTLTPKTTAMLPTTVKATFLVNTSCTVTPNSVRRYTVDWGDITETSVYEYTPTLCSNSANPGTQTTREESLTHQYSDAGSRTVKLRSLDGSVYIDSSASITLTLPDYAVTPIFGFAPLDVTATFTTDSSCSAGVAATGTYVLDWGDGTSTSKYEATLPKCASGVSPTTVEKTLKHTYKKVGNYTTILTITRSDVTKTITRTKDIVVDTKN